MSNRIVSPQIARFPFKDSSEELSYEGFIIDLQPLNTLLHTNNFQIIVQDESLFWAHFCKIFAQNKGFNSSEFDIKVVENQAYVKSEKFSLGTFSAPWSEANSYTSIIKREVECFRLLADEALKSYLAVNRVILAGKWPHKLFLKKPSTEPINLRGRSNLQDERFQSLFLELLYPHLHHLFGSLKIDYSESQTTQLIIHPFGDHPENVKAIAIQIALNKYHFYTYSIPPAPVPTVEIPNALFFEYFKSQRLCSYHILCSEGKSLPVHRDVLAIYGGPYFEALLSHPFAENIDRVIKIDAPYEIIENVVESIYLGPEHIKKKWVDGDGFDVYAVLQVAHTYALQPLFKEMINLLIVTTSPSHAQDIQSLADLYKDDDLQRLADHLIAKIHPERKG